MTTAEVLKKAREYVAQGWTQNAFARTASGEKVFEDNGGAVCWCAAGAIFKTAGDDEYRGSEARHQFRKANDIFHIPDWNDAPERTQADVLAAFDKAIALAEAAE